MPKTLITFRCEDSTLLEVERLSKLSVCNRSKILNMILADWIDKNIDKIDRYERQARPGRRDDD